MILMEGRFLLPSGQLGWKRKIAWGENLSLNRHEVLKDNYGPNSVSQEISSRDELLGGCGPILPGTYTVSDKCKEEENT